MKPITSILLVAAIICYCFLPLFNISLSESNISGLGYTGAMFSRHSFFALLPFISTFFAIGFNSLKNRYWGILVVIFIALGLFFFARVASTQELAIVHMPETIDNTEFSIGLPVKCMGIGYTSAASLLAIAMVSAIISLMPFKFNTLIEQSIDSWIDNDKEKGHHSS